MVRARRASRAPTALSLAADSGPKWLNGLCACGAEAESAGRTVGADGAPAGAATLSSASSTAEASLLLLMEAAESWSEGLMLIGDER